MIYSFLFTEAATPVNGPAVGDRLWLEGTNCGDAKCCRWSPWTKCGSRTWSGGTIHGCRTWLGRTDCGGTIGSVTVHQFSRQSSGTKHFIWLALDFFSAAFSGVWWSGRFRLVLFRQVEFWVAMPTVGSSVR